MKDLEPKQYDDVLDLLFEGKSQRAIETETKIPRKVLSKLFKNKEIKDLLTARAKLEVSKILPDAVNVLRKLVLEGNMDALKTTFKIVGAMDPEPLSVKADQSLTIILPGAQSPQPKTFEVQDENDPEAV